MLTANPAMPPVSVAEGSRGTFQGNRLAPTYGDHGFVERLIIVALELDLRLRFVAHEGHV